MGSIIVQQPAVASDSVRLVLADPDRRYQRVTLFQELQRPRLGPSFRRVLKGWSLEFARPAVDRMEYLLHVVEPDGMERPVTVNGRTLEPCPHLVWVQLQR